ncbi:hypothetical protein ABK040_000235 [Willaertia magna]
MFSFGDDENESEIDLFKEEDNVISEMYKKLNKEQLQAVTSTNGQVIVLAGPGTGKTSVLTYRIYWLVHKFGVDPRNICALTFSRRSAEEMKSRTMNLDEKLKGVSFATFHSKGYSILRKYNKDKNFKIADDKTVLNMLHEILERQRIEDYTVKDMRNEISLFKNFGIDPSIVNEKKPLGAQIPSRIFAPVYKEFEKILEEGNLLTHEDLLFKSVQLLKKDKNIHLHASNQVQYLLVDEYQDTNDLQYEFTLLLSQKHRRIFCVGDSKQAIFGWRFSNVHNFVKLTKDFNKAEIITLKQNYRSTSNILEASFDMLLSVTNTRGRKKKVENENDNNYSLIFDDSKARLESNKGIGDNIILKEVIDNREQSEYIIQMIRNEISKNKVKYRDIAILCRLNRLFRTLQQDLTDARIPYEIRQTNGYFSLPEIKNLMYYIEYIESCCITVQTPTKVNNQKNNIIALRNAFEIFPRRMYSQTKDAICKKALNCSSLREVIDFVRDSGQVKRQNVGYELDDEAIIEDLDEEERNYALEFLQLIDSLIEFSKNNINQPLNIVCELLDKLDYKEYLKTSDRSRFEEKWNNVLELKSIARDSENLSSFIQEIQMIEEQTNSSNDKVLLLTMHASKGLEFEVVFITDLIDGVVPHVAAAGTDQVEEEKRLLFVAMTRAKKRLYMITSRTEMKGDNANLAEPCPWLKTIQKKSYMEYQALPKTVHKKLQESDDLNSFLLDYRNETIYSNNDDFDDSLFACDMNTTSVSLNTSDESISTAPLFQTASMYLVDSQYRIDMQEEDYQEESQSTPIFMTANQAIRTPPSEKKRKVMN